MIRIRDINKPLQVMHGIDVMFPQIESYFGFLKLNVDPPYQRGNIWTLDQQTSFMGHVLCGGKVHPLIVNSTDRYESSGVYELLDGKQRLNATLKWLRGEIPADIGNGVKVFIHETDREFRFNHRTRVDFVSLNPIETLEFYLQLNSGGTPHSEADLDRVRKMLHEMRKTK